MSAKPGIINVARGDTIDQGALVRVLPYGSIAGVALDVFEEERPLPHSVPWNLSNVVVTTHTAWTTAKTTERWATLIEENYFAITAGDTESIVNRVL